MLNYIYIYNRINIKSSRRVKMGKITTGKSEPSGISTFTSVALLN